MFRAMLLLAAFSVLTRLPAPGQIVLRAGRSSPGDLEVGGELKGAAPGATRYIRYEDLLRLRRRLTPSATTPTSRAR